MSDWKDWMLSAQTADVPAFYSAIGVDVPASGAANVPVRCFTNTGAHAHDDRNKSCSVSLLTGLWHCKTCGEGGNAFQAAVRRGWQEHAARDLAKRYGVWKETEPKPEGPRLPDRRELKRYRVAMLQYTALQQRLYAVKGWSSQAIRQLRLGWDGSRVVFPIMEGKGSCSKKDTIAGVVRYSPRPPEGERKSKADPGSRRLLFPAPERIPARWTVFLVEGEPDAVSVWSLGLPAVAVPGAGSWTRNAQERLRDRRCVVLTDCDAPGRELGERIKRDLGEKAVVVDIAPGREDGYDVGDMVVEAQGEPGGVGHLADLLRDVVRRPVPSNPPGLSLPAWGSVPGRLLEDLSDEEWLRVFPGSSWEDAA
jgi:5S rRNA maturation endonuclease (ribonuclease M5)